MLQKQARSETPVEASSPPSDEVKKTDEQPVDE